MCQERLMAEMSDRGVFCRRGTIERQVEQDCSALLGESQASSGGGDVGGQPINCLSPRERARRGLASRKRPKQGFRKRLLGVVSNAMSDGALIVATCAVFCYQHHWSIWNAMERLDLFEAFGDNSELSI